jgi:signal transduction histidine kinase
MSEPCAGEQHHEEHQQAAARLRKQAPDILQAWAKTIRSQAPVASELDQVTLYNNLPRVLDQIADVLAAGDGRDAYAYARIPATEEHAQQRAGLKDYTLDVVILEYHLLRRVVVEIMEQGDPLPRDVGRVLHDGIDRAMQEAAVYFVAENERIRLAHDKTRRALTQQLLTAQETERHRISRELHDRSGQHLTALLLTLKSLEPFCPQQSASSVILAELQAGMNGLVRELHEVSEQLRPLVLDDLGLCPALMSFMEDCGKRSGIATKFHRSGVQTALIPSEIETTIFRVAQEAVTNVLRHAQATQVSVIVELHEGEVRLIVEDNGSGFDAATTITDSRRLGLRGMQERADLVGGGLEIESAPGEGTTLFLRVPLPTRV